LEQIYSTRRTRNKQNAEERARSRENLKEERRQKDGADLENKKQKVQNRLEAKRNSTARHQMSVGDLQLKASESYNARLEREMRASQNFEEELERLR
jgi:hypothetical protein